MQRYLAFGVLVSLLVAACSDTRDIRRRPDAGGDGALPSLEDADGDGIADVYEGRSEGVDTDGDGTPDYLDADSDGDGIDDATEAGAPAGAAPVDTDGDGVADFRDDDSDGNGIPDATEGAVDSDADTHPDSRDTDNDGDLLSDIEEIGPAPSMPIDSEGDGIPDYLDIDSDNDTIGDLHEGVADTDMDGLLDRFDLDSDADGWSDQEEAGDADPRTAPADTDGDFIADFRDPDSDADGLSDADERTHGTRRDAADTDGDGVTDLIEIGACGGDPACAGDVLDPTSSPRTRGDFVFLEPYMAAPDPPRDTLDFATDLRVADVYFLVDTTGSMGGAITNVRNSLSTPGGIIDQVRAVIPDTWFGAGGFDDYQVSPYGYASSGDRAYYHIRDMTMSAADAQAAVNTLTTHYGGDGPESLIPALWSAATGRGLPGMSGWSSDRSPACPATAPIGWACFRTGAVPIVVAITDIDSHNGPGGANAYNDASIGGHTPTYDETVAALTAANVRVIGVAVSGGGLSHLQALARDTGAVDGAGSPLVSSALSGSVSASVVDQIRTLANQTPIDISIVYDDDTADTVDTYAAFVDHLEANTAGDPARGCDARAAEDTNGDGYADTFRDVTPGSPVCFDIIVKQNDTVMPTPSPQIFHATLRVLGDGFTELDTRDIYFLVPPRVEIGGPD